MAEQWDGRPQNPERDGWHWLQLADDGWLVCKWWSAEQAGWVDGITLSPATVVEYGVGYLGPCLTPAEVEAREAAARREGIEAAAEVARCVPIPEDCCHNEAHGRLSAALEAAMRIRALLSEGER